MKKKKQHYVPKFYLRNFSSPNSKGQIGIFNIDPQYYFAKATLRDQACEPYFYDRDGELEGALSCLERFEAKMLSEVIQKSHLPTRRDLDRWWLLFLIADLSGRTKQRGLEANMASNHLAQLICESNEIEEEAYKNLEVNLVHPANVSLGISTSSWILICDLRFTLLRNCTSKEFITSDNPVVLINPLAEKLGVMDGALGFPSRGVSLFLPITPRLAICGQDSLIYRSFSKPGHDWAEITDSSVVQNINALQVLNCTKTLFFSACSEVQLRELVEAWGKFRAAQSLKIETVIVHDGENNRELIKTSVGRPTRFPKIQFLNFTPDGKNFKRWSVALLPRDNELVEDFYHHQTLVKQNDPIKLIEGLKKGVPLRKRYS